MVAFVANDSNGNPALLWVQALDSGLAHPLTGTEGATLPFWSPDGQHIGYFAQGKLWKIDQEGGPPQALSDAPLGRGGTWNQDGVVLFAPDPNGPLEEISASGAARAVSSLDSRRDTVHAWWPQFLPDGKHFIYWSHSKKALRSMEFTWRSWAPTSADCWLQLKQMDSTQTGICSTCMSKRCWPAAST